MLTNTISSGGNELEQTLRFWCWWTCRPSRVPGRERKPTTTNAQTKKSRHERKRLISPSLSIEEGAAANTFDPTASFSIPKANPNYTRPGFSRIYDSATDKACQRSRFFVLTTPAQPPVDSGTNDTLGLLSDGVTEATGVPSSFTISPSTSASSVAGVGTNPFVSTTVLPAPGCQLCCHCCVTTAAVSCRLLFWFRRWHARAKARHGANVSSGEAKLGNDNTQIGRTLRHSGAGCRQRVPQQGNE